GFPENRNDPDEQPDKVDQHEGGSWVLDHNQKRKREYDYGQRLELKIPKHHDRLRRTPLLAQVAVASLLCLTNDPVKEDVEPEPSRVDHGQGSHQRFSLGCPGGLCGIPQHDRDETRTPTDICNRDIAHTKLQNP